LLSSRLRSRCCSAGSDAGEGRADALADPPLVAVGAADERGSDYGEGEAARAQGILDVTAGAHVGRGGASASASAEGGEVDDPRAEPGGRLAAEIRARRSIIKALLHTDDRVVKSVTYRAIELLEAEAREDGTPSP